MRLSTASASWRSRDPARDGRPESSSGGPHLVERLGDDRAQPRAGTALLERALRFAHGDGSGVRDGERVVDARPGGGLAGEGDQRRALGLAQVAAGLAAGLRGRAEGADEVVDELEGEPEVAAGAVEDRQRILVGAGEHSARAQRCAEGVDGGLVERGVEDLVGLGDIAGDAVLDVGELARGRDEHGVVEQREQPLAGVGRHVGEGDEAECLVQQQVAGEDRGGVAEERRAGGIRPLRARACGTRPRRSGCRDAPCRGRSRRRARRTRCAAARTRRRPGSRPGVAAGSPPNASNAATTSAGRNRLPPVAARESASARAGKPPPRPPARMRTRASASSIASSMAGRAARWIMMPVGARGRRRTGGAAQPAGRATG